MIHQLHYITQEIEGKTVSEKTEEACEGGVRWVQFRAKNIGFDKWKSQALEIQRICKKYNAKLIINDNVKIAKQINADGVHLGKNDMDADKAREFLGSKFIIGGTANSFEDIQRLSNWKVDYIGLGPLRFTQTKKNLSPLIGMNGYFDIIQMMRKENINIPVIGIGGVMLEDIDELLTIGLHGIAVSSAITKAKNSTEEARKFITTIEE